MDDQLEALNPEAEETALPASPAEEQTTEEPGDVSPETPEAPRKGAQARIREVISENKSLKDKIAELTSPVGQQANYLPNQPQSATVDPDGNIDPNEFKRQVLAEANQMIDFRSRQNAMIQRINQETVEVVGKFKELDPESDSFDQELSDAIYEAVEAKVKADPTASVKDFVNKQMKIFKRSASREEAGEKAAISRQAVQSAIKPSQNRPVEQKFSDLSVEEMRNKLGYAE